MTDREIMQQALDALKLHLAHHEHGCVYLNPVMYALRQALAQPEQELNKFSFCGRVLDWNRAQEKPPIEIPKEYWVAQELWNLFYAAQPEQEPPKREWVGLTDKEMLEIWRQHGSYETLFKKVEIKLKDKNTT